MEVVELSIPDAYAVTPLQHRDDRGLFAEWFKEEAFAEATGRRLELRQANVSVSRRGTLRGVHYADVPPSQAKYVFCPSGAVLDVVVDVRLGSPAYGRWEAVRLDDADRRAVFLSEGLGHAFLALTDDATVTYLCSEGYAPGREHGINPLDAELGIDWPMPRDELLLSPKDAAAPSLAAARDALPTFEQCQELYAALRGVVSERA